MCVCVCVRVCVCVCVCVRVYVCVIQVNVGCIYTHGAVFTWNGIGAGIIQQDAIDTT